MAIRHCVSDMDFATDRFADLAAAFLVRSAGMAVALLDIPAVGTIPASPGSRSMIAKVASVHRVEPSLELTSPANRGLGEVT